MIRFLYYLVIVKRRITILTLTLALVVTAWGMKASVERAMVRNNPAPSEHIQSVLDRSIATDWDMCAQFHPKIADEGRGMISTLVAQPSVSNGELGSFNDLIEKCARVTVPLTEERAALARKKAGLPNI